MRGFFITLEGPDGAGKSTQGRLLEAYLRGAGVDVLSTREPGGTPIGERIRQILLDTNHAEMAAETEMLLFAAARAQLVRQVVRPALDGGTTVLSERYVDASLAYQGYGRGLDLGLVRAVNEAATGGLLPDLTVLLDIDPEVGLHRAWTAAREGTRGGDRLEREALAFHQRVRAGFLELARESPKRFVVVDAQDDVERVHQAVVQAVRELLGGRR
ncbi:MAG: dTMP kinase [Armatimonadota bacterium]|nr:dTMP kinase [Armatimonadota bacterium]MDR7426709.1 dTMP kinase [Armatimonadota bacterium]MDR7463737.1 dTMP kinase [Armatimonadota bacterium]MDR7469260.1 dTMP kinase [Armatimonadota bacterium]MDR7475120.1 dTMP kinase [Armatimonadota bacterium]